MDHGDLPRPRRRVLAGIAVGLAVGLCPLVGVVGGLAASYLVFSSWSLTLLASALVGGLVGALSGWVVSQWRRSGPWLSLVAVTVAVAVVVVPALLFSRQSHKVGDVVWAVVLVPVVYTVGVLVRRGAVLAGAATGLVGGLLAVDAGVMSLLAWLVRDLQTSPQLQRKVWLWFSYLDGRHSFPGSLDIADEIFFVPQGMIAATAFAVCLVLVTQRVEAIDPLLTR